MPGPPGGHWDLAGPTPSNLPSTDAFKNLAQDPNAGRGVGHVKTKVRSKPNSPAAGSGATGATVIGAFGFGDGRPAPLASPTSTAYSSGPGGAFAIKSPHAPGTGERQVTSAQWTKANRKKYVDSLDLSKMPNQDALGTTRLVEGSEEVVHLFLEDVVAQAPLPVPWEMYLDETYDQLYFYKPSKEEPTTSWSHPLDAAFREIADVCRMSLTFEKDAERKLKFSPGRIGMGGAHDGLITSVHPDGQAKKLGVEVGWKIEQIGEEPYSQALLDAKIAGGSSYDVTFRYGIQVATIDKFKERYMQEARADISKWRTVKHGTGEYFVNKETGDSMWEHPAERILPIHYVKVQALESLCNKEYMNGLIERAQRTTTSSFNSMLRGRQFTPAMFTPSFYNVPMLTPADGSAAQRPEAYKTGLYEIVFDERVPVTSDADRQSKAVAQVIKGARVEVIQIADALQDGEVRARIKSPAGWISLGRLDRDPHIVFANLLKAPSSYKTGPYKIIHDTTVPVTCDVDTQSKVVAGVSRGAQVEVLQIAHTLEEGNIRARIKSPAGWISLGQYNDEPPIVFAETNKASSYKTGLYEITCDKTVPVTCDRDRQSKVVAGITKGAQVEVLQIADELEDGRVRARIETPEGWISLCQFVDDSYEEFAGAYKALLEYTTSEAKLIFPDATEQDVKEQQEQLKAWKEHYELDMKARIDKAVSSEETFQLALVQANEKLKEAQTAHVEAQKTEAEVSDRAELVQASGAANRVAMQAIERREQLEAEGAAEILSHAELEERLQNAIVVQKRLQGELNEQKNAAQVQKIKEMARDAESELAERRRYTESAQKEVASLKDVCEMAERSRHDLENRLAAVQQELVKSQAALSANAIDQGSAVLMEALQAEERGRTRLLDKEKALLEERAGLKEDLRQIESLRDALQKDLAKAESDLSANIADGKANRAREELAEEGIQKSELDFQNALGRTKEAQRARGALQARIEANQLLPRPEPVETSASAPVAQASDEGPVDDTALVRNLEEEQAKELQNVEEAQKQCSELSRDRDQALERLAEARSSRGLLEERLAGLEAQEENRNPEGDEERVTSLLAALEAEKECHMELHAKLKEMPSSRDLKDDIFASRERHLHAEMQVAKEHGQVKHNVEKLQQSEAAKAALVARLEAMEEELHKNHLALERVDDGRVQALQAALDEEQERQNQLIGQCEELGAAKDALERQCEAVMTSKAALYDKRRTSSRGGARVSLTGGLSELGLLERQLLSAAETELALKEELSQAGLEVNRAQEAIEEGKGVLLSMQAELAQEKDSRQNTETATRALKEAIASAEQEVAERKEGLQDDVDKCIIRLQSALADAHYLGNKAQRDAKKLEKKIQGTSSNRAALKQQLAKTDAELKAALKSNRSFANQALGPVSTELAEERQRMLEEADAHRQAEDARTSAMAKMESAEQGLKARSDALSAMEGNLKERDAMLARGKTLAARLSTVEKNLQKREREAADQISRNIASLQSAIAQEQGQYADLVGAEQKKANVNDLEKQLERAESYHEMMQEELAAAKDRIQSNQEMLSDLKVATTQTQEQREQQRLVAEQARKEQAGLLRAREEAEEAKGALQSQLAAMEQEIKNREASRPMLRQQELENQRIAKEMKTQTANDSSQLAVEAPSRVEEKPSLPASVQIDSKEAPARAEEKSLPLASQLDPPAPEPEESLPVNTQAMRFNRSQRRFFSSSEGLQMSGDADGAPAQVARSLDDATGTDHPPVCSQTGEEQQAEQPLGTNKQEEPDTALWAGDSGVSTYMPAEPSKEEPSVDAEPSLEEPSLRKEKPKPPSIQTYERGGFSVDPASAWDAPPGMVLSPAGKSGSGSVELAGSDMLSPNSAGGHAKAGRLPKPVWAHSAQKLFKNLDGLGTGFIDGQQVLQLWPVLSRYMESASADGLAARLMHGMSPMSNREWMSLMSALSNVMGPKRLRHNIHSAQAYFQELQANDATGERPDSGPKGHQRVPQISSTRGQRHQDGALRSN